MKSTGSPGKHDPRVDLSMPAISPHRPLINGASPTRYVHNQNSANITFVFFWAQLRRGFEQDAMLKIKRHRTNS